MGVHKSEVFDNHYEEIITKILPDFAVNSDEQFHVDKELVDHYLAMQAEHDIARNSASQRYSNQSTRQGFYNMNGRNGTRS